MDFLDKLSYLCLLLFNESKFTMRILIEYAALGIEMFAVAIIVIAIVHGTIRYLVRVSQQAGDA